MIRLGTINDGALPILADLGGGLGEAVPVILSVDYFPEQPPGFPARPSFVGAAVPHHPKKLSAGSKITVYAAEAMALIAAAAARLDYSKASLMTVAADGNRQPVPVSAIVSEIVAELLTDDAPDLAKALAPHLSANLGGKP